MKNNAKCVVALFLTLAMLFVVSIAAGAAPAKPMLTPTGCGDNSSPMHIYFTIPANVEVFFTLDGTTPNSGSARVSGSPPYISFTFPPGGATLKAIAIENNDWSDPSDMAVEFYTSEPWPTSIALMPNTLSLVSGGTHALTIDVQPLGAVNPYTWSSSDPAVAAVDQNGNVTAGVAGTATITAASLNNLSATCAVAVSSPPQPQPPQQPPKPGVSLGSGSVEGGVQPKPPYEQAKIGNCKEWAYVRSGPGTNHDIIGQVYLGEEIELLRWDETETWCEVFYSGGNKIGWVHGRFIITQN